VAALLSPNDWIQIALGLRAPVVYFGGGGGSGGPTLQQQQLEKNQAMTTAEQNLEENEQRKGILSAAFGTRVFRGSALSRALRGNTSGNEATGAPSATQRRNSNAPIVAPQSSLLDARESRASGATPAGGAGASASVSAASYGGRTGGGIGNR